MKRQLLCPSCEHTFHAEDMTADMPCPACQTLLVEVAVGEAEEAEDAAAAAPQPAGRASAASVEQAGSSPPLAQEREEVVCPRCSLHFHPKRAVTAAARSRRRAVLVIENMDYFMDLAREVLEPRFRVRMARDVDQARAVLGEGGIDLVVLNPAVGGGRDHGNQLLEELPFKPCPILIYTDTEESVLHGEIWERLQQLGADDVVVKGMNAGESVLRKVAALLNEPLDDEHAESA